MKSRTCREMLKTLLKSMGVSEYQPRLVIQTKVNFSFSQPPPRVVLLVELARNRSRMPLPKSITGPGIPLPPHQIKTL
ncbi:hypothetical protein MKX01_018086 [Papaver californicum]|nr:hypothetical protein MKX01_018086 [Papaver californicum]